MTIEKALSVLRQNYVTRHPQSAARYEEATTVMPGGNTRSVLFYDPFPLAIARGEDSQLWDADGHAYTDFIGEFTAGLYGHSHPVIRQAILQALDGGINLTGHNLLEAQLAKLITQRFINVKQLRFTNSGTEANLLAIAAARQFTQRKQVLVFKGGYHGGVLTFAGGPSPINVPYDFILGTYNDLPATANLIKANASHLAAIVVEPMQGAGGCVVGTAEFLHGLRQLATQSGALLVFDEVMTSRLAPGGRQQLLSIAPDLTTLGKYIGGGMSFGAFGGRMDVMAQFDPRVSGHLSHAGTFNNNVLSMSAGIAGLTQLYTPEAALTLNARGDAMRQRLNEACHAHDVNLQFTGLGSMMNLHGTRNPINNCDDHPPTEQLIKDLFFFHMLEQGFYVARRGFIVLSLPITNEDIDRFVASFEDFLQRYKSFMND